MIPDNLRASRVIPDIGKSTPQLNEAPSDPTAGARSVSLHRGESVMLRDYGSRPREFPKVCAQVYGGT